MNNPTLGEFCFAMIGRADIEGSKSNVAMNAWLPQASYPCGNFSDTSSCNCRKSKGSIGHNFLVCIRTENQYQTSFSPFGPHEISVLIELTVIPSWRGTPSRVLLRFRVTTPSPQQRTLAGALLLPIGSMSPMTVFSVMVLSIPSPREMTGEGPAR